MFHSHVVLNVILYILCIPVPLEFLIKVAIFSISNNVKKLCICLSYEENNRRIMK